MEYITSSEYVFGICIYTTTTGIHKYIFSFDFNLQTLSLNLHLSREETVL